jgi:hypothetical protein
MLSKRLVDIQQKRTKSNDVYYTPESLVRIHLAFIKAQPGERILEPFAGQDAYFKLFPEYFKECKYFWTEIERGRDFFNWNAPVDIIVSNPPFSKIKQVLEKSVSLSPRIISYLIGHMNLTTSRLEFMNKHNYGLVGIHFANVRQWFGGSVILVFEKDKPNIVSYDRKAHNFVTIVRPEGQK